MFIGLHKYKMHISSVYVYQNKVFNNLYKVEDPFI